MIDLVAARVPDAVAKIGRKPLLSALEGSKRARVLRMQVPEDQDRSAVADILSRMAIARRLGEGSPPVQVVADQCGQPLLPDAPWLHLSVAHAGNWATCAAGLEPVGVDVECVRSIGKETEAHLLSATEAEQASAFEGDDRRWLVCGLWTVKESFVKALGIGWEVAPESLTVRMVGDGEVRLVGPAGAEEYHFRLYPLDGDHLAALCSRTGKFPEAVERVEPAVLNRLVADLPTI